MSEKDLDQLLNHENFYFSYEVGNVIWVFYLIRQPIDELSTFLETVYGVHFRLYDKTKPWNPEGHYHALFINLRAPYDPIKKKYVIRELVGTVLHELIHAMGIKNEDAVYHLEEELLKGYRFSRIDIE